MGVVVMGILWAIKGLGHAGRRSALGEDPARQQRAVGEQRRMRPQRRIGGRQRRVAAGSGGCGRSGIGGRRARRRQRGRRDGVGVSGAAAGVVRAGPAAAAAGWGSRGKSEMGVMVVAGVDRRGQLSCPRAKFDQ